jgi:hypothetical protein
MDQVAARQQRRRDVRKQQITQVVAIEGAEQDGRLVRGRSGPLRP